jgi:AcrR family transcriptional regulator
MPSAIDPAAPPDSGRARIMDEAATLFLQRGYEATSLRHIADTVGMKAGSLYYHFASKEELLTEILRRGIDVMEAAFEAASRTSDGRAPAERIEIHVRAHLAALFENGPYTAAHVTTFRTAPAAVRAAIVPIRDEYEARWTRLLRTLQADGRIPPTVDVNMARLVLFGAMNASVEWFDAERGSLDRFAAAITHQFWNGLAA